MASPYKMKNSTLKMAAKGGPLQKNYAGSPMESDKPGKLQKLWDKYGPSINANTKTEEGINKGDVIKTISPGFGKTKTTEVTSGNSSELSKSTKNYLKKNRPKSKLLKNQEVQFNQI